MVVSVAYGDADRAIVTVVPHTTELRGSPFEVSVSTPFLRQGAFLVPVSYTHLVWANSFPPDDRPETQETITLTLDFAKDLRQFLERECRNYLARQ